MGTSPSWELLQRLRRHSEDMSLMAALRCQGEDLDPSVMRALTEDIEMNLSSSLYADMLIHEDTKQRKSMDADRKLALKLAQDWGAMTESDTSLLMSLERQEAEANTDADVARCIDDLPDGAAFVILEAQADSMGPEELLKEQNGAAQPAIPEAQGSLLSNSGVDRHTNHDTDTEPGSKSVGSRLAETTAFGLFDFDQLATAEDRAGDEVRGALDTCVDSFDDLPPLEEVERRDCLVCADAFDGDSLARLPCKHHMCYPCLRKFYCFALGDITMLPVMCCDICLPVDLATKVLDTAELNRFLKLSEEKMAAHKMYCPNLSCARLINLTGLNMLNGFHLTSCPSCCAELCMNCKAASHPGQSCEEYKSSSEDALLHETAAQFGWKQCPKCSFYVSLRFGCNHMTCHCGFEFCYICLDDWTQGKPCDCPLFDPENLLLEEERRVHVQEERLGRQLQRMEVVQVHRQLMQDNMLGNECNHRSKASFSYREFSTTRSKRGGVRTCGNCGGAIPRFGYECENCNLRICHTCRFNRRVN
eukprot:TRINITY_DN75074_c0_g1_i1.p1 TRINITY_DN75074_c0_g1~~TRINITY_DN75074_c0_g1_i1.p1  ORF type:complete len:533 (+),score=108.84 TRINITY_DN75074_c0_g1_i1:203-1801(+)